MAAPIMLPFLLPLYISTFLKSSIELKNCIHNTFIILIIDDDTKIR